ncbi:phosphoenolpyruvate carboxykinase (ATP) 1-like [Zingiber officinale]|uniref:phosphoenolpyruvate carboxykinase (ATP) 1-like n=1 Tax=Zingiber officinale TaxID=94328 RepID=UPI001C4AC941|nr:phosphoenolpyruvate carboxykinase (ATP) 1-like [Zingiber officinale]
MHGREKPENGICHDDSAPPVKAKTIDELHSLQKKRSAPTTPIKDSAQQGNATFATISEEERQKLQLQSIRSIFNLQTSISFSIIKKGGNIQIPCRILVGHRRINFSKPKRKQFLRTRILEAPEPRLKNPPAAEEPKKNKKIIVEDEIDVKYKSFKKFDTVKEHSDHYFSIPEHLDMVFRLVGKLRCIRTTPEELEDFSTPDFTIYNVGQFPCNRYTHYMTTSTSIDLNLDRKEMVILGTQYAGEMKKGLFGVMHYLMPKRNILSLHSSNNMGKDGDVALFFGLSGTGKTTLSTDHNRLLIGDDEHCWSENDISNIEGGCYAKCIGLTKEKEPDIWNAIKFGTVLENIVFDEHTREVDYSDNSITENTRASYPIEYIPNAKIPCVGLHPKNGILLACDAFGVLPLVSKLTLPQTMYHFISGYTALVHSPLHQAHRYVLENDVDVDPYIE